MSVEKMKAACISGRMSKLDAVINVCLQSDWFHAESAVDALNSVQGLKRIKNDNNSAVQLNRLNNLFKQFGVQPPKDGYNSAKHFSNGIIDEKLNELNEKLEKAQLERARLEARNEELSAKIEDLKHFTALNLHLDALFDCEFIKVRFGRIPKDSYAKLSHHPSDEILFYPTSCDDAYYWGMYVAPVRAVKEVDRIFASLFFEKFILPDNAGTPQEIMDSYKAEAESNSLEIEKQVQILTNFFNDHKEECQALYAQLKRECDMAEVKQLACEYNNSFMLIGWVPESRVKEFTEAAEKVGKLDIEFSEPEEMSRMTPPTRLKNNALFRPFQFFVEIYGTPAYKEVDPTPFVAITYSLIYGIMFADLGQGLVLSLVGYLMWKIKGMALGKALIPCGISGALFGLVFGSVFGFEHVLDPMYRAIGFKEKPIDVMHSATSLLAFSIGIGIALLLIAMVLGVVSNFKRREIGNAVFSSGGIAGLLFYAGILIVAGSLLFGIKIPMGLAVVLFIVIPVISILLAHPLSSLVEGNGFKVHSVGDYILETVFELIEVILSMFSNTVSFLRVGAFVLIHAGMMLAFTSLVEIVGGGVGGAVLMVFGNIFVIVLEGLLVGIQVLRLEFYEMFSRFYNGNGNKFTPMSSLIKNN